MRSLLGSFVVDLIKSSMADERVLVCEDEAEEGGAVSLFLECDSVSSSSSVVDAARERERERLDV